MQKVMGGVSDHLSAVGVGLSLGAARESGAVAAVSLLESLIGS